MILRAIFWIGLVSLFMPHEPDLGFGRPGAAPAAVNGLIQAETPACHAAACAHGPSLLDGIQAYAVRSLDRVRADISASHTGHSRSDL